MAISLEGCSDAELIAASNLAAAVEADEGGTYRTVSQIDWWVAVVDELKRRADVRDGQRKITAALYAQVSAQQQAPGIGKFGNLGA